MPRPVRPRPAARPARSTGKGRIAGGKKALRKGRGVRWGRVALVALLGLAAVVGAFFLSLPSVEPLRAGPAPVTAMMAARFEESAKAGRAARHNQHWVRLESISPLLREAVVNSEDARFFDHEGVDVVETQAALERAVQQGHLGRGASTLTQQLAKNLWLGEERSLLRKVKEAVLARRLEALGKERVLELYLNVVEWGDGIYGADAAARVWFGKPALQLRAEEAAILAAMLPAPRRRNPRHPSARLKTRAREILELYGLYHQLPADELQAARARLSETLGAP